MSSTTFNQLRFMFLVNRNKPMTEKCKECDCIDSFFCEKRCKRNKIKFSSMNEKIVNHNVFNYFIPNYNK